MVVSAIFSLPLFLRWAICHCWLMNVVGPAYSIGWLHTLYTVMIVIFLFCLPRIVAHVHLPIPWGSLPCVVTLGCNVGWYGFHQVCMVMTMVSLIRNVMLMILPFACLLYHCISYELVDASSFYLFQVDIICLCRVLRYYR